MLWSIGFSLLVHVTCERRRHYHKYDKIYIVNQHTYLSFILESQRQFQMVSQKMYNPDVNEEDI